MKLVSSLIWFKCAWSNTKTHLIWTRYLKQIYILSSTELTKLNQSSIFEYNLLTWHKRSFLLCRLYGRMNNVNVRQHSSLRVCTLCAFSGNHVLRRWPSHVGRKRTMLANVCLLYVGSATTSAVAVLFGEWIRENVNCSTVLGPRFLRIAMGHAVDEFSLQSFQRN